MASIPLEPTFELNQPVEVTLAGQATAASEATPLIQPEEALSTRQVWANRGRAAVLGYCVGPGNELTRYFAFGAAEAAGAPAPVSALVFAGASVVIEGLSSKFGARLLSRPAGEKTADLVNRGAEKIGMTKGVRMNAPLKLATALFGGAFVNQVVEKVEDPAIEERKLKEKGYIATAAIAGVMAVQGYAMAKGFDRFDIKYALGGAAAAVGALAGGASYLKRVISRRSEEQNAPDLSIGGTI